MSKIIIRTKQTKMEKFELGPKQKEFIESLKQKVVNNPVTQVMKLMAEEHAGRYLSYEEFLTHL